MIPCVIGLRVDEAENLLESQGYSVRTIEYVSRRGIENADSTRVIRQRVVGNNNIEITVSHFRTKVEL